MVAQLVKSIGPKKLKVKEVRLRILNELRREGKIVKTELEKTTATWKGEKPTFTFAIGLTGKDAIVLVGPAGSEEGAQKWVWLDEGTRPHIIKAKNAPNLVFRTKFTAKTVPKVFISRAGSIKPPWRKTKQVKHPGIEEREWSKEIVKKRTKPFIKRLSKAAKV